MLRVSHLARTAQASLTDKGTPGLRARLFIVPIGMIPSVLSLKESTGYVVNSAIATCSDDQIEAFINCLACQPFTGVF
jgi:hypothetical protein